MSFIKTDNGAQTPAAASNDSNTGRGQVPTNPPTSGIGPGAQGGASSVPASSASRGNPPSNPPTTGIGPGDGGGSTAVPKDTHKSGVHADASGAPLASVQRS